MKNSDEFINKIAKMAREEGYTDFLFVIAKDEEKIIALRNKNAKTFESQSAIKIALIWDYLSDLIMSMKRISNVLLPFRFKNIAHYGNENKVVKGDKL